MLLCLIFSCPLNDLKSVLKTDGKDKKAVVEEKKAII
jgi:hypothetical protein